MLWDAHPLHLGATPRQVWIDGIAQLGHSTPTPDRTAAPVLVGRAKAGRVFAAAPAVPAWDAERAAALAHEGLPPLAAQRVVRGQAVLRGVREVWVRGEEGLVARWGARAGEEGAATVVLTNGAITCVGAEGWCVGAEGESEVELDLRGGAVGPGLMTFGSPLGIEEIAGEPTTQDGLAPNAFVRNPPGILHDTGAVVRAVDALQFGTRNAL